MVHVSVSERTISALRKKKKKHSQRYTLPGLHYTWLYKQTLFYQYPADC